jgi:hypothetical protein
MNKELIIKMINDVLEDIKNDRLIQATEKLFELKLIIEIGGE